MVVGSRTLPKYLPQTLVCAFVFLASTPVQGALIEADWNGGAVGNNNIVIDTETGLQWLDISVTTGMSYSEVSSLMSSGAAFDGFRYASQAEVMNFMDANMTGATRSEQAASLYEILSILDGNNASACTGLYSRCTNAIQGLVSDSPPLYGSEERHYVGSYWTIYYEPGTTYPTEAWDYSVDFLAQVEQYESVSQDFIGSYLVSTTSVPEPSALVLLVLGLAGMSLVQRKTAPKSS